MVNTLPSNAGAVGSIPGRGAEVAHVLSPKKPQHKLRSNIVTNLVKAESLRMVTAAMKLKDACSLEGKLGPT